jgi:hypothetical protein
MSETLALLKSTNPQVEELLNELKEVQLGLYILHCQKIQHRKRTRWGTIHDCKTCQMWTRAQEHLRRKRTEICTELQKIGYGLDPMELMEVDNY